jgi:protein-tyrosine phosphatase
LAEGILRRQAELAGLEIEIDSAGTGDYHIGQLPDQRAIRVGKTRGCEMSMRARQFRSQDFEDFDLIVPMDLNNARTLENWHSFQPAKVKLARSFDARANTIEVPDPYYGTILDFEEVADMLESACEGILEFVKNQKQRPSHP